MAIYQVEDERVSLKPVKTTRDFAELLAVAPVDLGELERDMLPLDQQPTPVVHHFAPGVYMREARLPAGCLLLGHRQSRPHMDVMLSGRVTMAEGTDLQAPMVLMGAPGRKCGVIHEDVTWLNIYATEEQDVGTLEAWFLDKSEAALAQEWAQAHDATEAVLEAQADYQRMLRDLGVTHELVQAQSALQEDRVKLPWGSYKFRTAPSPISGNGVFASAEIEAGEWIGPASILGHRTVLGYGVNHSGRPNARMAGAGNGLNLVAIRPIKGNRGGLFGEEITVDYREARKAALCLGL